MIRELPFFHGLEIILLKIRKYSSIDYQIWFLSTLASWKILL